MKNLLVLCFILIAFYSGYAQETEDSVTVKGLTLYGTLTIPANVKSKIPMVVIIAGSGPTDRNCNGQGGLKTDAFKKMSAYFAENGIASFRYDKRGVGKSTNADVHEEDLRFDDLVNDAKAIVAKFQSDDRFSRVIVAGHSEGSLVGMMSVNSNCRYISISGIATSAADVMKTQLKGQLGNKEALCFKKLDSLKNGMMVSADDTISQMLFRKSVQPYLISWFKYNPTTEIQNVNCPMLIVSGGKDLQVGLEHGSQLHEANLWSQLYVVELMNHVMVETTADTRAENLKTYTQPELPLSEMFLHEMMAFIKH